MTDSAASQRPSWHRFIPVATILVGLLPILLAPVRARELSPEGRGEFAFFQSSFMIISAAGALGARHAYYAIRGSGEADAPLLGPGAAVSAWAASAVVGIPLLVISLLQHSPPTSVLIVLMLAAGPLHLFVQLQLARAQFDRDALRVAVTTGVPALWEFVVNIVLVLVNSMTVLTVSVATAAAEVARGLVSIRKRLPAPISVIALRRRYRLQLWRYAPVGIMPMLVGNIDVIVYGAALPQSELGYYAVAKLAVTLMVFATVVIEGRLARVEQGLVRTAIAVLLLLAAVAAVGGVLGTLLVPPLFGTAYQPAANIFGLMAVAGFLGGTHVLLTARAAALQHARLVLLSSTAVLIATASAAVLVSRPGIPMAWLAAPISIGYAIGVLILVSGLVRRPTPMTEGV